MPKPKSTPVATPMPQVVTEEFPPPPPPPPPAIPLETKPVESSSWDRVIHGFLYALTFLLPLLLTPWTFEPLEFSKQMLLFVLTAAALIAWLLKLLVTRSFKIIRTPLDLPLGVFLVIYLLASLFSIDRVASFLGFYGSFSGNFFQVLFLALFYYLVVNNFTKPRELKRLFGVFFFSVFLALLYIVLQFFGWFVISLPFAKVETFNTIGGLLTISIFSALAILLSLGFRSVSSWFSPFGGRLWRILTIACSLLILLTVNFVYAWAALLVGLLLYLIFNLAVAKSLAIKNLITPLVLVILVVSFLVVQLVFPFVSLRNLLRFNLPLEVRLDYTTASPVLKGVATSQPILGSGPNTFLYAFSKYREEKFNLSPFWNVRFDKSPSEATEYLVGTGVLGLLAFEILTLIFIVFSLVFLFRRKDQETWLMALSVFGGFVVLWLAHWFFFFNTVIAFSFWLMLSLFVATMGVAGGGEVKVYNFSFAQSPRRTVSVVSSVSLALVLVIIFLFFASAVYASDIFYRRAVRAVNDPAKFPEAQADFEQALRLNRFRPDYFLAYGEFLFLRINQELAKADPNPGLIQNWLASSINTSRAAVNLSPANWTAWERLATLYTLSRPLVAGVDRFIIESLLKATQQDTKNPILWTELGQVYRLAARKLDPAILGKGVDSDADGLSDEQEQTLGSDPEDPDTNGNNVLDGNEVLAGLNPASSGALPNEFLGRYLKTDAESLVKAEEAFRKAVSLKEDYATAYYQLALTLEQQGRIDKAVEEMEKLLQRFPTNLNLKFELGRMYFNSGKIDQAARQFQEITFLVPNHSNARFSLAVSYERLGKTRRALEEYRKVLELNPDNEALKTKVTQLQEQLANQEGSR